MAVYKAKSTIDSVIIYQDRVQVKRIINANLKQPVDIIISDLPGSIDDQSVRTKAKGLKIGEVQVKKGYIRELSPAIRTLEKKIKKILIEDRSLADEIIVQQDKQKFLTNISVSGPEVISNELFKGKVSPISWRQGLRFLGDELLKAKMRIAQIERRRNELKERIDALKKEMNDIKSLSQNRKAIIFDAHPKRAGKHRIELSYIIYGASWYTYYELRAHLAGAKVGFTYFGKITQRTGEDWNNTRVALSTARPVIGGTAPEPEPWYIDLYAPRPAKKARVFAAKSAAAPAEMESRADLGDEMQEIAPVIDTGIAITYPLPGRFTIKSGEPEKKVKIVDELLDAEFSYFIMPRLAELAYSTGRLVNNTEYLFLSGEGNTYVGDDYTGKAYLETIAPDEKVTISFGVDDRVKVKRKTKKYHVKKGGLVKKTIRYEFVYENTVKNFHAKEIKCKIVDQVPIPRSPEIKISDVKIEPAPTKEDKDQRIFHWEVLIRPGKEYKIKVAFNVEAPSDSEIQGLIL